MGQRPSSPVATGEKLLPLGPLRKGGEFMDSPVDCFGKRGKPCKGGRPLVTANMIKSLKPSDRAV